MRELDQNQLGRLGAAGILGPDRNETRAWLDHLAMGKPCVLATPQQARATLEATLAIEHSMATGNPITLPLDERNLSAGSVSAESASP